MTDLIRYPIHADTALQYSSSELYSATAEDTTEGAHQVRDLHIKLENILKRDGGGGSVDREIEGFVYEMLRVDVPMQERYRRLDLTDLLKKNKNIKGKDGLPFVSAALGILEKYGRNLLKPNRPPQWKTISFSNAVFRTRVDNIKGARDVLCLLGYSEVVEDGVRFPDSMQAPDANVVAMVTSDLILAKAEIEAFSRKSHPHPERVTEAMEGTIAAIQYPAVPDDPGMEGGTVYMRQTSVQQPQRTNASRADWSGQRSATYPTSGVQPASTGLSKPPPPHTPKPAWSVGSMQNSALTGQTATISSDSGTSSTASSDFRNCSMCGQDTATKSCNMCKDKLRCEQCDNKWHGHPQRKYHQRQNMESNEVVIPQEQSPPKMCSVCGGNQASQHCQQCDADFCDACGKKMHLHPKRKNHTLQPLPGGAIRRAPEGSSIRIPPVENRSREPVIEQIYPTQPEIKRPDTLSNQQIPFVQHPGTSPQHPGTSTVHSTAPSVGQDQQQVLAARKRPVPKPRRNIPQTPTSPQREWRPTASLSTNVGMQQVEATSPVSPVDPRKLEMEDIMSRDVELLERIASLRDSLRSVQRQTPQHASLAQMEVDLWNEHKELLQRQAELERSLKEPPSIPIHRGHSMTADIRRPPLGDKPSGSPSLHPPDRPSASPYGRSQSARRSQDQVPSLHPPAEGWECNSCGFLNDDRPQCEGCSVPYGGSSHGAFNQPSQTAQVTQQPPAPIKSPSRMAAQQAKILEAQLPGGMPFGIPTPGQPGAISKGWSCQYCTFDNTLDISVCQACNKMRERQDAEPAPQSPKFPVQRQQTEGMAAKDEKHLTAYEYMQLEEEKMLKAKLAAKAEDDANQKLTGGISQPPDIAPKPVTSTVRGSPQPPDISPKPINGGASVEGASMVPTVAKRNKYPEFAPRFQGGSESLKISHLGEGGSGREGDHESLLSPTSQIQLQQDRRILAEQAMHGLAFINVLRQAETNGFCVEDVTVASQVIQEQQSDEDIVPWLQQNWDDYKSTATVQATHALSTMQGSQERIQLSEEEVVEALYKHDGNIEKVVHECIEQRNQKVAMLENYGFENQQAVQAISMCDGDLDKALMRLQVAMLENYGFENQQAVQAISMCDGDLDKALMKLQVTNIDPFYDRLWETDDDDAVLLNKLKGIPEDPIEHERYLRLLIAEFRMNSWGRAITAERLIATNNYSDINSVITAARECGDYERAKQFLEQECQVCYAQFPHNQLMGLMFCNNCLICSECLTDHFRIVIQQRNITHATCPACAKPDVSNYSELAEHFTFLDSLLRPLLDDETHALFLRKLRDWSLQKEENFRWCAHCGNGFINEAPDRRKMRCPECAEITCYECKKPWMEQHEQITCQEFEQWKQDNDPKRQDEGVAYHLKENGIGCPQCKMRYELAKGGCMHFKCPQCMFEFCCGCNKPFVGNECGKLPSCATRGLHSHHPRDCLFHLRDWDVKKLQKLLDKHNIKYDTDPPQNQGGQKGCRVEEQKESPDGLIDGECGREAPAKHAGLCRLHYTEYLVGLINQNLIDPAETFDLKELEIVLNRNEIQAPQRGSGESEQVYQKRLLKEVQEKLPFGDKPPRDRP